MSEPVDIFREKLKVFEEMVNKEHELEEGELRTALQGLSKELKATPDLVFLLEDQEIGTIAKGSMIVTGTKAALEAKAKKPRAKAPKKISVTELKPDEILF